MQLKSDPCLEKEVWKRLEWRLRRVKCLFKNFLLEQNNKMSAETIIHHNAAKHWSNWSFYDYGHLLREPNMRWLQLFRCEILLLLSLWFNCKLKILPYKQCHIVLLELVVGGFVVFLHSVLWYYEQSAVKNNRLSSQYDQPILCTNCKEMHTMWYTLQCILQYYSEYTVWKCWFIARISHSLCLLQCHKHADTNTQSCQTSAVNWSQAQATMTSPTI